MSNPYGWSQPTDDQPAVYFAPPGENIRVSDSADNGFGAYQSLAARGARPGVSMIDATILWLKNWKQLLRTRLTQRVLVGSGPGCSSVR